MRCVKCGAEWTANITAPISSCPFCGEPLMGTIPHQQAVDTIRMIVERFGIEIYAEEKRLFGLINDMFPNTSKEKNVLKTVVFLGIPKLLSTILTEDADRAEVLEKACELMEKGGLDDDWCTASLFILSMPLGIDSTDLYPLDDKRNGPGFDIRTVAFFYNEQTEEEYSGKSFDELLILALTGDVVAETELGERYYSGNCMMREKRSAIIPRWRLSITGKQQIRATLRLSMHLDKCTILERHVKKMILRLCIGS